MDQITLRPGDFCRWNQNADSVKEKILRAFQSAGCQLEPCTHSYQDDSFIVWDVGRDGLATYTERDVEEYCRDAKRLLTLDQVLNATNAKPEVKEWRGPEDGLPPIGSVVELSKGTRSFTPKHGREGEEVIILCHTAAPNGAAVAAYCSEDTNNNPASGIGVAWVFSVARTEEEKAVEEISDIMIEASGHAAGIHDFYHIAKSVYKWHEKQLADSTD